ncbi:MAG: ChbG/HpnK family deacetylase, partial [Nanoarchaeota archaeon]|nr:ChbG/HpnK family deacetylase [Nanoarchaeota archaeon]
PLTKSKTLIDKNGTFIDKIKWFGGYYKNVNKNDVEDEIEAQILQAISSGLKITHINGHNHIHIFPNVIDVVIKLAKKHRIRCIRVSNDTSYSKYLKEQGKKSMLTQFSKIAKNKIIKNKLKTADVFYGILNMNDMDFYKLSKIFESIKNGTSELMMHPAYINKNGDSFHQSKQREKEIELLINNQIKNLIKKQHIRLINFSQT